MRKGKIVATIGPASESPEMLLKLIEAGVDTCRLNFSFGDHEGHLVRIKNIREAARKAGRAVAILQDLQGPKIRVGKLKEPIKVEKGEILILTGGTEHKERLRLPTTYKQIAKDCEEGKTILLADGKIILKVKTANAKKDEVHCEVINGGEILSGKGINLPYTKISLPALTEKDEADAIFGAKAGVDYIGLSFVRSPEDVKKLRKLLESHGTPVPIIAKIEKPEAMDHLAEVLDSVEGVMVARGDLAVELSYSKVPAAQKRILHEANVKGKITITATEMLSSMVENPLPTRAEVSDVANAIWDGSDAVMLSNESAMGKYPVETVKTMAQIIEDTESSKGIFRHDSPYLESLDLPSLVKETDAMCKAAAMLSHDANERALAVLTFSGTSAKILSKYRPDTIIYAICASKTVRDRLALLHNVTPIAALGKNEGGTVAAFERVLLARGLAIPGDEVICLSGENLKKDSGVDTIRLIRLR